ncbi:MAG: hypothetical protein V2A79_03500 [Planctomycetota bacterium]
MTDSFGELRWFFVIRWMFMLGAVCFLSGCHRPPQPVEWTAQEVALAEEDEGDALFEACLEALRAHGFKIDRVDRRAGLITTFPVTSQQFFEFWRHDVDTAYDLMEASLDTVRRRVEVRLLGETDPLHKKLVVTVFREKFSTPDRQYNTSAAAFRVFGRSLPATTGEPIVPERDNLWLPAGRDGVLERRLIDQITECLFARVAGAPEASPAPAVEG